MNYLLILLVILVLFISFFLLHYAIVEETYLADYPKYKSCMCRTMI
jgi:hypothetical protein